MEHGILSVDWSEDRTSLSSMHCWFDVDRVPGRPDITSFKRRARWHQARWREAKELPRGEHRSAGVMRQNFSRLSLATATETGANFLSDGIRRAVRQRLDNPQRHQTLNTERLWSDLLSSMPMCFNLFGELPGDPGRRAAAIGSLFPDHPGTVSDVCFEWSPGRRDPTYLGNRTAFDAAVLFDLPNGERGVIGIETKYHEHAKAEVRPDAKSRMPRYREVTERSGLFVDGWEAAILGTPLQQIWLDHLLVLSMLQHPSDRWAWGRFVLVHPARNPSFAETAAAYRELLVDDETFSVVTIEALLDEHVLHPPEIEAAFRERYLW